MYAVTQTIFWIAGSVVRLSMLVLLDSADWINGE